MSQWFIRVIHLPGFDRLLPLLFAIVGGLLASQFVYYYQVHEHTERLETETERRAKNLMSFTMNGNLMGAIGLLGITDPDLKREARGEVLPDSNPRITGILESTVRSFDAAGLFLIDAEGNIGSSWYASGKASTGRNLRFRPYYRMAKAGLNNVYAAIGTGNHEPILYYAVPVFSGTLNQTEVVGALVARLGMQKIDNLLSEQADISLLLSPQGIVFATNRQDWFGKITGALTPERIGAIRELKQFGTMFDKNDPEPLPLALGEQQIELDGHRYAVSKATVNWNDPTGEWHLIALENLSRSIPLTPRLLAAGGIGLIAGLLAMLLIRLFHSREAQIKAGEALAAHARQQSEHAEHKAGIARAAVRLHSATSLEELAQALLSEANQLLKAVQGVVYMTTPDQQLKLAGCFACPETPPAMLARGEGIIGQCALDRQSRLLGASIHAPTIRSGLGAAPPKALLIVPVVLQEKVLGVIELALISKAGEHDLAVLEELAALLAIGIEVGRFDRGGAS